MRRVVNLKPGVSFINFDAAVTQQRVCQSSMHDEMSDTVTS